MLAVLANDRTMAKKPPGRPKKNPEMTGIRIDKRSNDLAREACGIYGESIVMYVSRVVRERAEADILENARRRVQEAEEATKKKAKPTGE